MTEAEERMICGYHVDLAVKRMRAGVSAFTTRRQRVNAELQRSTALPMVVHHRAAAVSACARAKG